MSATVNASLFADYFGKNTPILHIPGRTFPVQTFYLEDVLDVFKYIPNDREYTRQTRSFTHVKENENSFQQIPDELLNESDLQKRYTNSSVSTCKSLHVMDFEKIQFPLIEQIVLLFAMQFVGLEGKNIPGSSNSKTFKTLNQNKQHCLLEMTQETSDYRGILIFLPGYSEISTLLESLSSQPQLRAMTDNGKFILPLHGTLTSEEQRRVFLKPPLGCVKIILATNVAETSITIDDIILVIDSGRMKETHYDPSKGMISLDECWISKANSIQRRGRAGRVSPGKCIHLFTSHRFNEILPAQQLPEISRTPLEQLCLRLKIMPILQGKIQDILSHMIEPPDEASIQSAIETLVTLQALKEDESLTSLGYHLGRLPVDVRVGKLLLYGCIFGCADSILTIAAIMSFKSPFVAPFDKRKEAQERKNEFSFEKSDHLTFLNAYNQWQAIKTQGRRMEHAFLRQNYLSVNIFFFDIFYLLV